MLEKFASELATTIGGAAGGVAGYDIANKIKGLKSMPGRILLGSALAAAGYFAGKKISEFK